MQLIEIISKVNAQGVTQIPAHDISISELVMRIVSWGLWLGGAVAVIYIMYGGILYITSAGDEAKAEQGRNTLTYAIIGVILVACSIVAITWMNNIINNNA
jgi:hypothetical protein